jgi:hypothetical protein
LDLREYRVIAENALFHYAFSVKRYVSLRVFAEKVTFHSVYSPEMHNSASFPNTPFTAESAQFFSSFSPTMISLTLRFRQKRKV